MDNKYYIPAIEDLRVGYECEAARVSTGNKETAEWIKVVIKDTTIKQYVDLFVAEAVRTPYLTKEQIEQEGWKLYDVKNNQFRKGTYLLIHKSDSNKIEIGDTDSSWGVQVKYSGTCPSINEFRTICKLIGVK